MREPHDVLYKCGNFPKQPLFGNNSAACVPSPDELCRGEAVDNHWARLDTRMITIKMVCDTCCYGLLFLTLPGERVRVYPARSHPSSGRHGEE